MMSPSVEEQSFDGASGRRCAVCFTARPSILHLLPYRGLHHHLCTACVLDSHPSSFCPIYFDVFLHNSTQPRLVSNGKNALLSHTSLASLMFLSPLLTTCALVILNLISLSSVLLPIMLIISLKSTPICLNGWLLLLPLFLSRSQMPLL